MLGKYGEMKETMERMCNHQRQVRDCEVEGSIYNIENDLLVFLGWGFISHNEHDDLLCIVKGCTREELGDILYKEMEKKIKRLEKLS